MQTEILIALIGKMVDERLALSPTKRGPRGIPGRDGADGKDFIFAEHEGAIRDWAKEFALAFEDLSDDQIENLRGPRGSDGRDGVDGRSFVFEENRDAIESCIRESIVGIKDSLKLRFSDLTDDEIGQIRGPRGRDGHPGRDFNFEENRDAIESSIHSGVERIKPELKLRYDDLSEQERSELRGPRGRDGHPGRDFDFEEHREFFESLKMRFEDLTDAERESLKLRFNQLTDVERDSLKLRFEDLSSEDKLALRGPRGLRGQRGSHGRDGKDGLSIRGLPGLHGLRGIPGQHGIDGRDGLNGRDAPYITDIQIEEYGKNEFRFVFEFSDGTEIRSKRLTLPAPVYVTQSGGAGGGGSRKVDQDIIVDEPSAILTYVGYAPIGSDTSAAVWKVKRLQVIGSETIIEYADSNPFFDNVWDDRASFSYG